jgi:hypothetical protein
MVNSIKLFILLSLIVWPIFGMNVIIFMTSMKIEEVILENWIYFNMNLLYGLAFICCLMFSFL